MTPIIKLFVTAMFFMPLAYAMDSLQSIVARCHYSLLADRNGLEDLHGAASEDLLTQEFDSYSAEFFHHAIQQVNTELQKPLSEEGQSELVDFREFLIEQRTRWVMYCIGHHAPALQQVVDSFATAVADSNDSGDELF